MLPRTQRLFYPKRRYSTKTTFISTDTSPSTLFTQTFKKVTAYPFCVDPWHAQAMMDVTAALIKAKRLSLRPKMALYHHWREQDGGRLFQLYSQYLKSRTPLRVKALYFPSWNIWGAASFEVLQRDFKKQEKNVPLLDRHLPGSATPVNLAGSHINNCPDPTQLETASLAECINPFGLEAECLPFTISPFALIDMAKSCPDSESKVMIDHNLFLPSSLVVSLFAAFPVMYPFYTSEYTCPATKDTPEWKFTLFSHAHGTGPRIAGLYPRSPQQERVQASYTNPVDKGYIDPQKYPDYELIKHLTSIPALRTDDDSCIRPMKTEELDPVLRYIELRKAFFLACSEDVSTWSKSLRAEYIAKIIELEKRSNEYIPSWWNQSRLAELATMKKLPEAEKKERPLRSRSSPIGNINITPTSPNTKKSKRKSG